MNQQVRLLKSTLRPYQVYFKHSLALYSLHNRLKLSDWGQNLKTFMMEYWQ